VVENDLQYVGTVVKVDNYFAGSRGVTLPLYVEVDAIFNLACPASTAQSTCLVWPNGWARVSPGLRPARCMAIRWCIRSRKNNGARQPDRNTFVLRRGQALRGNSLTIGASIGFQSRGARVFNTYGPRMQPGDGRVVSSFIVQALKGDPITVFGDGGQTRSFCYVDDLVEAICRLMLTEEACTGPINLGNNAKFTILELAEKVISFTGSQSKLIYKPLPQDDPRQRQPDLSKAKAALDWEPKVALADGLKETIAYFKRSLELS
jgi:UDP-glucuronate decarboxylase